MNATVSQITGISIVYSTDCSGADQRKYQSSASLILWGEFTGVTGESDDIIMSSRIYKLSHIEHWWVLPIKSGYRTTSVVIIHAFCYEVGPFLFLCRQTSTFHTTTLFLPGCDSSLREQLSAYKCLATVMPGHQISQNNVREALAWIIVR